MRALLVANPKATTTSARTREVIAHALSASVDLDAPFAGVPFVLKDAVCHSAGDPFHAGMRVLKDAGWVAPDDTWLAARFRAAHALD